MPDSSWLGWLVLYHLPWPPDEMLSEALPMHRHISSCSPLLGREEADWRRPQRQEAVSMKEGRFVGEVQPWPREMQLLLEVLDILDDQASIRSTFVMNVYAR